MSAPTSALRKYEYVLRRTFWFPMMKVIFWNIFIYLLNIGIVYLAYLFEFSVPEVRLHLFFNLTGLVGTLWILLRWHALRYTLTNKKIVLEKGILNIDRDTFLLRNIECVKLHKNIWGRICWYGTLEMYAPTLQETVFLLHISNAQKYFKLIQKSIAGHRRAQVVYPSSRHGLQKNITRERVKMV